MRIRDSDEPHSVRHLVAVHDGQVPVEHDHVIAGLPRGIQRGRAVEDDVDGHAGIAQALRDTLGQRRVVLHHQHPHGDHCATRGVTSVRHRG
jgi:hypothetical protein